MPSLVRIALRVLDPMEAVKRVPYVGICKPRHPKHMGDNVRPRCVTEADRLIYDVFDDRVEFLQARCHY